MLHPVSVSNFTGPKRGVFCILIINMIPINTLVVFSLLCESNYHYSRGSIKVGLFKIHIRLLRIAVVQSISLQWDNNIILIYMKLRYKWRITFAYNVYWPMTILLFLSCLILKYYGTLIFSQTSNLFNWGIFMNGTF